MHYILSLIALGASASAIQTINQNSQCTFPMTAVSDPKDGPVENAAIGESRIGGANEQDVYSLSPPTLSDSQGRNCVVDPSSAQFYCSQGTHGNANFTVASDGNLMHNGDAKWLACPDADGSYAIYTDAKPDTAGCKAITIKTYVHNSQLSLGTVVYFSLSSGDASCNVLSCPAQASTGSSLTRAASTSTVSVSPISAGTLSAISTPQVTALDPSCPKDISSGEFRFPLLILPTSPEAPDYAFGNSYVAYISHDNTTIFNFDVPESSPYTGKCALLFLFPYESTLSLQNSTFYFSGIEEEEGENGGLDFALLKDVADSEVTYKTTPGVEMDYGKTEILPGNNYTIATFPCKSGMSSYSVSSVGDVELDYFQDSDTTPIGLYIVPCSS